MRPRHTSGRPVHPWIQALLASFLGRNETEEEGDERETEERERGGVSEREVVENYWLVRH